MKTKRSYLTVPGQRIEILIQGDSAVGKTQLAEKIKALVQGDGLLASCDEGNGYSEVTITCPTEREARDLYLASLSGHESATLQGHLDALGYEL